MTQVVDEDGAARWSEVTSTSYDTESLEDVPYVTLSSGGHPVAGVFAGAEQRPYEGHEAWLAYFRSRFGATFVAIEHRGQSRLGHTT